MPICISAKHIVEQIRLHISKPKSMSQASLMSLWSDISLIWKENRRRGGDDFFFRSICHPIEQKIWMFLIRTFVYPPHKMSGLAWLENDNSNREAWRVRNGQKKSFPREEVKGYNYSEKRNTDGPLQGIYIIRQTIHHSHAKMCSHDSQNVTFLLFLTVPPHKRGSRHLLRHHFCTSRDLRFKSVTRRCRPMAHNSEKLGKKERHRNICSTPNKWNKKVQA